MIGSKFKRVGAAIVLLLAAPSVALAQGAPKSAQLELARQAEQLKPGEWVWKPEIAPKGPILVYVDLTRQLATVYRNGVRIGVSTVSTGREGYETPTGVFTILEKNRQHFSSKYNNAPMPYQQRLTMDGVALHAGGHKDPVMRPAAGVLAPPRDGTLAGSATAQLAPEGTFTWTPEASASGPVSIIISTGDQQVVVLRNGVEIGRAHAVVSPETNQPQVMTFAGGAKAQWIQVGVSDLKGESAEIISTERVEQMQLPAGFAAGMRSVIAPGTTVLVTEASVKTGSGGQTRTVIDAQKL